MDQAARAGTSPAILSWWSGLSPLRRCGVALWLMGWSVVVYGSLASLSGAITSVPDKLLHVAIYGGMTVLALLFCRHRPELIWACAITLAASFLIEHLQLLNPARSYEPLDLVANVVGAAGGLVAGLVLLPFTRQIAARFS